MKVESLYEYLDREVECGDFLKFLRKKCLSSRKIELEYYLKLEILVSEIKVRDEDCFVVPSQVYVNVTAPVLIKKAMEGKVKQMINLFYSFRDELKLLLQTWSKFETINGKLFADLFGKKVRLGRLFLYIKEAAVHAATKIDDLALDPFSFEQEQQIDELYSWLSESDGYVPLLIQIASYSERLQFYASCLEYSHSRLTDLLLAYFELAYEPGVPFKFQDIVSYVRESIPESEQITFLQILDILSSPEFPLPFISYFLGEL